MGGGGVVSVRIYDKYRGSFNVCNIRNQIFFCVTDLKKKAIFFHSWLVMDAVKIKWWQKLYLFSHTLKFNIKSFRLLFFQFVLGNGWFCFEKQN